MELLAFEFLCGLHKVKYKINLKPRVQKAIASIEQEKTVAQNIFKLLKTPISVETMRKQLNAQEVDLTRAMTALIKKNKIKRSAKSKKNWVRA